MKQKDAVGKKPSKSELVCSACGCHMWLWDEMQHRWHGEYHFNDCPSRPGGAELFVRNLEAKADWEEESFVPRPQGLRILEAIMLMLQSPTHEIMLKRKAAIQKEITNLSKQLEPVGEAKE